MKFIYHLKRQHSVAASLLSITVLHQSSFEICITFFLLKFISRFHSIYSSIHTRTQ